MFESKKKLAGVITAILFFGLIMLILLPKLIYSGLLGVSEKQYVEVWNQEEKVFVTYQEYTVPSNMPYAPSGVHWFLAEEICSDRHGEHTSSAWNFMVGSAQKYENKMNLSLDNWTVGGGIQVVHKGDAESCIKLRRSDETEVQLVRKNKSIKKIVGLNNPNEKHYDSVPTAILRKDTVDKVNKMAKDGKIDSEEFRNLKESLNDSK
ncbi:MAG: hypothetical protein ACI977_000653 [Candidatus Nanohaloarchaea archaeon]|jgi:hypothetical protein